MSDTDDKTSVTRAIMALLAGSFMGSSVLVLCMTVSGAVADGTAAAAVPAQIFNMAIILLPLVFMAFAGAALFIAAPCWSVLHLMGRRTGIEAAMLGGLTACTVSLLLPEGVHVQRLVLSGVIAAMTAWRVAYGAQRKTGGIAPARSITSR